jgi:hypothetical protein
MLVVCGDYVNLSGGNINTTKMITEIVRRW